MPIDFIDPTKKKDALTFISKMPISDELKISLTFQWTKATGATLRGEQVKFVLGEVEFDDVG